MLCNTRNSYDYSILFHIKQKDKKKTRDMDIVCSIEIIYAIPYKYIAADKVLYNNKK